MTDTLLEDTRGPVRVLTLHRPAAMNAIDTALRERLIVALNAANADDAVRAVMITGAGERAFCSGQDLGETAAYGVDDVADWLAANHRMYRAVRALDKPAVAAFNGTTAGAGFQIGLCCDLRVGYPEMRIGQPEIRAGLASIVGSQMMTWHIALGHNVELSLLGDLVTGQRAWEMGLLSRLVPRAEVVSTALGLAERLASQPATALRLTKQRFRAQTDAAFESALEAAVTAQRTAYGSGEPQAAMARFLAARRDAPKAP
jgi:enoyl-CoA hydratase/carnithine racemase